MKTSREKVQSLNFVKKQSEKDKNLQRLESLIELSGWKAAEIARRLNIKPSRISNWRSGGHKIPTEILDLLSMKIADEKLPKDKPNGILLAEAVRAFLAPIIAYARGGEGAYPEDMGHDVPRIAVPCKDPNCYVLELEGDSMEPVYLEGDLLVVAPNMEAMNNDLVIVKTTDEEVFFKKLRKPRTEKDGEHFQFLSFNPHHPALLLRPDQIHRVSVVHSVIRPLKERVKAMAVSDSVHL